MVMGMVDRINVANLSYLGNFSSFSCNSRFSNYNPKSKIKKRVANNSKSITTLRIIKLKSIVIKNLRRKLIFWLKWLIN